MRHILTALFMLAASPSFAMFKCVGAGGAVSFQETPCAGGGAQTNIREAYVAEKIGAKTEAPAARQSLAEQSKEMEADRRRRDTEYALRDKKAQLANFRERCDSEVRAIAANRFGWNNNLAGATRSQAEATAANAHATACDTQARQIEGDIAELQRRCTDQKCDPSRAFN